jgi:hypothetical protein
MDIVIFPAGKYLTSIKISDDIDKNIFTLLLGTEMISKDRKEF